jgi:LEA14-like dessication related protein
MRRFLVLLLALFALAPTGCAMLEPHLPPDVYLSDLKFEQAGLFEQRVNVILHFRNPNEFDLPIDGFRFDLGLNGQPFARGFSNESLTVPRLGEAYAAANTSIATLDMVRQVLALADGRDLSYDLKGTAFIQGMRRTSTPFAQSGSFNLSGKGR